MYPFLVYFIFVFSSASLASLPFHVIYLSILSSNFCMFCIILFENNAAKRSVSYCFKHICVHTHDEFLQARASTWTKSNTQKQVIIELQWRWKKRKIFFLNLTTNKTRSTASNDWLKRDGDVKVHSKEELEAEEIVSLQDENTHKKRRSYLI